jgi:DNA polymerase epsilon subunit 2
VFVPGPNDPGLGHILPQLRLPTYFTSELAAVLPNAVFATNPCRCGCRGMVCLRIGV